MSNPRTPIDELQFFDSPNLKRALARPPLPELQKREELEKIFNEVRERREEALLDVKENGMVIEVDKFNRGQVYLARVINPALKIVQACERQLAQLAKLLTATKQDPHQKPSAEQSLADLDSIFRQAGIHEKSRN